MPVYMLFNAISFSSIPYVMSQDNRIIQVGGDLRRFPVQLKGGEASCKDRWGCSGLYPIKLWNHPGMETAQLLWATWSTAWLPSLWKSFSLNPVCSHIVPSSLVLPLCCEYPGTAFLVTFQWCWGLLLGALKASSSTGWASAAPSATSHGASAQALTVLLTFCWTPSHLSMSWMDTVL